MRTLIQNKENMVSHSQQAIWWQLENFLIKIFWLEMFTYIWEFIKLYI